MLLHTIGGVCFYCTGPDADWSLPYGERDDYELWPYCPGGKRQVQPRSDREPEPAPASSHGTNAQNGAVSANAAGAQTSAGVSWRDGGPVLATGPVYALEYSDRRGGDWTDLSETDGPAWG
jgi:hypothetical protein